MKRKVFASIAVIVVFVICLAGGLGHIQDEKEKNRVGDGRERKI